jgi:hypothetical protein
MTSVLATNAIITLAQAKRHLGFGNSIDDDLSQDEQTTIEELINAASEYIEDRLGRKIKQQTVTDEVYTVNTVMKVDELGRGYYTIPTYLQLNNFPLITLTSVKFDDITQTITEGSTTGFYYTSPDLLKEGKIYYSAGWPTSPRSIKITYTCGYATVPYFFQEIAKEIVLFLAEKSKFNNSRNILINASSDGTKSNSGTPAYRSLSEIWDHFKEQLAPYQGHWT